MFPEKDTFWIDHRLKHVDAGLKDPGCSLCNTAFIGGYLVRIGDDVYQLLEPIVTEGDIWFVLPYLIDGQKSYSIKPDIKEARTFGPLPPELVERVQELWPTVGLIYTADSFPFPGETGEQ